MKNKNSKINLSGPISYSYYKLGDKNIHLFGDLHFSLDNQCKEKSQDFIKYLNSKFNIDKEIDIFVEVPYDKIERNNKNSFFKYFSNYITKETTKTYLEKFYKYFEMNGCFKRSKIECTKYYHNVRFHAADFRFSSKCTSATYLFTLLNYMFILNSYVHQGIQDRIISNKYILIEKIDTLNKLLTIFNGVFKCKKMNDQLKKIDKIKREKIENYVRDKIKYFKESQKEYNKHIKKIINYFKSKNEINSIFWISQSIEYVLSIVLNVNCLVMDTYLLSRMMKNDFKNIVVYAGEYHINEYRYFLSKYMKFKREERGVPKNMRCIEIKDFNF